MLVAVIFQVCRRDELHPTHATDVWFFARVERPDVTDEPIRLDELGIAVLAAVWFVGAVDVRVALEAVSRGELHAAVSAHEGLLAGVAHQVIAQLIEILVALVADRAREGLAAWLRRPAPPNRGLRLRRDGMTRG